VVKRPTQRLLQAAEAQRETCVTEDAAWRAAAQVSGAKHVCVDAAPFYADVDLHGKGVRKGPPALVASPSPRSGEKASYSSAVWLETGEVEARPLTGNGSAATAVCFLPQRRAHHAACGVLGPRARPGRCPRRDDRPTPALPRRLVRLPAYSPDFTADEHLWAWVRAEVTAPSCCGTADKVRAHVDPFFAGLATRTDEVKQRCRRELQSRADARDAVRAATTILHDVRQAA
jgi:hypothetical protein